MTLLLHCNFLDAFSYSFPHFIFLSHLVALPPQSIQTPVIPSPLSLQLSFFYTHRLFLPNHHLGFPIFLPPAYQHPSVSINFFHQNFSHCDLLLFLSFFLPSSTVYHLVTFWHFFILYLSPTKSISCCHFYPVMFLIIFPCFFSFPMSFYSFFHCLDHLTLSHLVWDVCGPLQNDYLTLLHLVYDVCGPLHNQVQSFLWSKTSTYIF